MARALIGQLQRVGGAKRTLRAASTLFLSVQTETVAVWLLPAQRRNQATKFSRCSSADTSFQTDTNGLHVSSLFTSKFSFQLGDKIRVNRGATSNGSSTKL